MTDDIESGTASAPRPTEGEPLGPDAEAPHVETPAAGATEPDAKPPSRDRVELFAAILLGLAATLTAFAAYRASLVSDEVLKGYSDANETMQEGFDLLGAGDQASNFERTLFLQYIVERSAGNVDAADYLGATMSPEMLALIQVWTEDPDDSIPTPFDGEYPELAEIESSQIYAEGQALLDDAAEQRKLAEDADAKSDIFELSTVLLAVTLFLAGVAALIKSRRISYALLGLGSLVLIAGAGVLIWAETY